MSILYQTGGIRHLELQEPEKPQLYRDMFPYSSVCRTTFDQVLLTPRPSSVMRITDTTFRDGQQARPPYTVKQICHMFDLLHRLGGKTGLISMSEFFIYSPKDRKAVDSCRARGYRYPKITSWVRATKDDLRLSKDMGFTETGLLTSVSDYHIFLKLNKTRQQAMDMYLSIVEQALDWGIVPRCHFEDVTRSDIYGFCLPFAQKLMELSEQSGMPVKIRLCDTMGYGVPYAGSALPRSVQRIVRAFIDEAGVPGENLEWHGHNDFHKVLVNGVTAWLFGCSAVNSTLLGFGERTGNSPLEALVIEYISLTGDDAAADTTVITEIAEYFERELKYHIPHNYPFAGRDFNATSAGVHADGLTKNEEIYNIFDTRVLLNRPVPIIITDKTGRAGVAYWINNNLHLPEGKRVSKKHPAVGQIYDAIMAVYAETGRTTSFSHEEMETLVGRFMPELFSTEFDHVKLLAGDLAAKLILRLAAHKDLLDFGEKAQAKLEAFAAEFPFIQYLYLTDTKGLLKCSTITDPNYKAKYEALPIGYDFSQREWFQIPMHTGDLHIMDVCQSLFTSKLIITVSCAVTDAKDIIVGVLGVDIQLESLLKHARSLKQQQEAQSSEEQEEGEALPPPDGTD
ncbi:MAG: histone-lysine N-methyltransferase [Desulfovibrio sp.]|jgi:isopropylmalate/homocitrate/citramalate synthase|nr:histone-lysine N-methyltransferase [Desulfovibrio sp.]